MKKREEENADMLHCKNCDGYYDPSLPNCPHCGEETANNINSAGDNTLDVTQYGGGFGEAGSPLGRTAMLIIIALLLVALVVIVAAGVRAISSMSPPSADSSISEVESTPPESSQEPEEEPAKPEEPQQPEEPEEPPQEEEPVEVVSPDAIELKYYDLTLVSGETQPLSPTVTPGDWEGDLTFTTDNKNVATVDGEGNVTYVGGGDCYITVSAGETEAKCIIRCKGSAAGSAGGSQSVTGHYTGSGVTSNNDEPEETEAPEPEEPVEEPEPEQPEEEEPEQEEPASSGSVTLDLTDITLVHIGDGYQFSASGGNGSYTWSSSNSSVATVSSSGFVTAVGSGRATITCSSGGASVTATVRVK